jgi:integrase
MSSAQRWPARATASRLEHLSTIAEDYINARELCPKQRERIRQHVRAFNDWRDARIEPSRGETESAALSAWLSQLNPDYNPSTVNNHRQSVISLLRFATPDGDPLPRADRIRRQKEPDTHKAAFTQDELRLLLAEVSRYRPMTIRTFGRGIRGDKIPRHRPDGIPWSLWWDAFIRVAYDSGQYLSDLRLVPWASVGNDGAVTFVRHKTGKTMSFRLGPAAIAASRRLKQPALVLPWSFDMAAYFAREFKKFVATVSGVRVLGPKSLRRSALTYTYMAHGEEAARILAGHSSFATTAKHYIDWSIARRPIVSPPDLEPAAPTDVALASASESHLGEMQ